VVTPHSKALLGALQKGSELASRLQLSIPEYDAVLDHNLEWTFGIKDKAVETDRYGAIYERAFAGRKLLVLKQVRNYHREYAWS
jgi:hypothetical protein